MLHITNPYKHYQPAISTPQPAIRSYLCHVSTPRQTHHPELSGWLICSAFNPRNHKKQDNNHKLDKLLIINYRRVKSKKSSINELSFPTQFIWSLSSSFPETKGWFAYKSKKPGFIAAFSSDLLFYHLISAICVILALMPECVRGLWMSELEYAIHRIGQFALTEEVAWKSFYHGQKSRFMFYSSAPCCHHLL